MGEAGVDRGLSSGGQEGPGGGCVLTVTAMQDPATPGSGLDCREASLGLDQQQS